MNSRSIGDDQWHLRKAQSLLKLLAMAEGHRLHREQAMELLWPDLHPEAALNNLHYALRVARRALEPPALASSAPSRYLRLRSEQLTLCPDSPLWVDVEAFEEAAATARHALEPAAYRAAIELYSGELLPQDRYEVWAEERRAQLRGAYLSLLLELARLYEEREELGEAIEAFQRVVTEEPGQEEAHAGLMRLYTLCGRRREALLQYEVLRDALSRELGAEPGANTRRLHEEIRAGSLPVAPPLPSSAGRPPEEPADSSRHNLPATLTSFVGREREIVEIKRALSMTRLLSLTGAGGAGKTRLAQEVARDLVGAYPDGVWLVELAPLSDPALVPQAVSQALGVREQPDRPLLETLKDVLRSRKMILVVDNCEHLVDTAASLADALLSSCPMLRILATSREPLYVPGEVVWAVPPLSLPGGDQGSTVESLMRTEAVRLFMDRARSRLPGFEVTEENVGAVMRVCRKLEGIPLAIELAAARMGALAVEQVAQRLEDSLKLLTGGSRTVEPRQQTLRATLDWSHGLLSDAEGKLFRRLSVFAGGWTMEAAEVVCPGEGIDEDDVLDLLSKLVEKSLVVAETSSSPGAGGALRYRMLEPVRQYGRERLDEGGETERVRDRHARHYLKLAEAARPNLVGPEEAAWLARLEEEHDNLRAVLSWTIQGLEVEIGARLALALWRFWDWRGYLSEGRRWLESVLVLDGTDGRTEGAAPVLPALTRTTLLHVAGNLARAQGDYERAVALYEESLAVRREGGHKKGISASLHQLGIVEYERGEYERAVRLHEQALALSREIEFTYGIAIVLSTLADVVRARGDLERAGTLLEESLALFRRLGHAWGFARTLTSLGGVACEAGEDARASTLYEEGLELERMSGNKLGAAACLEGLARVAAARGEPERAARLCGAAAALREEIDAPLPPVARADHERHVAAARAGLGEEAFESAWAQGRAMDPERAIEYALSREEEERQPPTLVAVSEQQPPGGERTQALTRREQEVALLVARGLTNRQIALELSISEHTVASHVRKILKKLGLRSRAQISSS